MGTGLQSLSQVTGQDMAKVLCILAMASTLSAAPTSDPYYGSRPRINSAVDADSVVESVMRTLGPEMDAAIEAAMRGLSSPVTGFSSGLRGLSSSAPVTNFRPTSVVVLQSLSTSLGHPGERTLSPSGLPNRHLHQNIATLNPIQHLELGQISDRQVSVPLALVPLVLGPLLVLDPQASQTKKQ